MKRKAIADIFQWKIERCFEIRIQKFGMHERQSGTGPMIQAHREEFRSCILISLHRMRSQFFIQMTIRLHLISIANMEHLL